MYEKTHSSQQNRGGGGGGGGGKHIQPNMPSSFQALTDRHVFKPVPVRPDPDAVNVGEEIAGSISRQKLLTLINKFIRSPIIKKLATDQGLDEYMFHQATVSFRKFCLEVDKIPTDLYVLLSDILSGSPDHHPDDIYPYFLQHAKRVFPHLDCLDDLRLISDLTDPTNWYPEARLVDRKIIFHSGPTNSGKTYHALERYLAAKSGVYCGPLKMLAVEVCNKANARGTPCDLVTGEERRYAREDGEPSSHVSCTVEMTNVTQSYEVAVIDEIQMIKDSQRGWAWTRALLGVNAQEIHVCGEGAAINLVKELLLHAGEEVEVRTYNRLTKLEKQTQALGSLDKVEPGDCIVCFNKQDIYSVSRGLEKLGVECAVIYGSLPPGTKLAMSARFNDPADPCKVMVATDAIGMGLNLNIRRIIFYSLQKINLAPETKEYKLDVISVSQALQIAGRAGRFNTQWETGFVTCFKQEDVEMMHQLLAQTPEELLQAGLHPTFDQIEMYAYHLPHASLSNLVDIFVHLSEVNADLYSLSNLDDFKYLADVIEHIPMTLKAKYQFCCSPINRRMPFVCTMFVKIARQFSKGELLTFQWLCHQIDYPFSPPETILDLMHMEAVHDVLDLYLWLSYRFPDMFPDVELVRLVQRELDRIIEEGVANIVQLLLNAESPPPSKADGSSSSSSSGTAAAAAGRKAPVKNRSLHKAAAAFESSQAAATSDATEKAAAAAAAAASSSEQLESIKSSQRFSQIASKVKVRASQSRESGGSTPSSKRLSDQLVEQGLLTPDMVETLRREWEQKQSSILAAEKNDVK